MARDPMGTTISVDISQLKKNLHEANVLIQENERQWRVSASAMDDWTKEEDGLTKRLSILKNNLNTYEENIEDVLEVKERLIREGYEPESKEMIKVNKHLDDQLKNLEKTKKELKQVTTQYDKFTKENSEANEEIEDTTQESKKASKALDNLEDSAKDAGDGFTIAKGAIAGFLANGLTAIVSMAGQAVSSLMGLTESTLEYRREMARITTVADQVGVSGDRIIDKWMDMNAVIQDESSVTEGLNNLMTAGFTAEKELDGITKALEGASIQWAETLKFEGLSDSLQEWIGSDGASLTGQFAELLERLGYNLEDVAEQTKGMTDAQRRNWAIQTLNKEGLSDVSDAYREANADMIAYNKANADLLHAQSQLGEEMQPFVTTIKQSTADILYSFMDMVNGVDGAGDQLLYNIGYLVGQIYKSVSDLVKTMLPTIASFFPQVIELITTNLPSMLEQGVAIITNIINGIAQNIPQVATQISTMLSGILLMVSENAPALFNSALNLFGQIVLAIPAMIVDLSAQLPTIITSVMDGLYNGENSVYDTALNLLLQIVNAIPSMLDQLLANLPAIIDSILNSMNDALPKVLDGAKKLLMEIVHAIPSIVTSLGQNLPQIINSIISGLSNALPQVASGAVDLFMEIVNAIPSIAASVLEAMPQIISAILKGLWDGASAIFDAGVDLIKGLIDGILSFDVKGALKSVGSGILNGFKSFFGIQSPSKLMRDEVGYYIGEGVIEGIEETTDEIADTAEVVANSFGNGFADGLNGTKKELKEAVEETIEDATKNANPNPKPNPNLGKAIEDVVSKSIEGVNIATDFASVLKEGDVTKTADSLFNMAGQFGGIWGTLADSIWSFISDNLFNRSDEEVMATAQQMVTNLLNTIISIMTNLPQIISAGITFIKEFAKGLIQGIPQIIATLPQIISQMITTFIAEGIPALFEVGAELIKGLIQGMFSINLWDVIFSIGNGIVNGFKALFGIRSPSQVMADEIGKNLALGMEEGITDNLSGVNDAIRNGVDTSLQMDGMQRKYVTVNQTNNYAQAHSRYELYKTKHDTANAVRLAMQGV